MSSIFVTNVDQNKGEDIRKQLVKYNFTFSTPQYTVFAAKKPGISVTLYQSGKLVVQGKNKDEFVTKLTLFDDSESKYQPTIGTDEAGKGDFFGPLCVAGLHLNTKEDHLKLLYMGVMDSKKMEDKKIRIIANRIKESFVNHVVVISPPTYNLLYNKFQNLNHLLAWGHAKVINQLSETTGCKDIVVDQFAKKSLLEQSVDNPLLSINQLYRGESISVVAGASILARNRFLEEIESLNQKYDFVFPKGSSQKVLDAARKFAGTNNISDVSKTHFKTTLQI